MHRSKAKVAERAADDAWPVSLLVCQLVLYTLNALHS